MRRAFVVAVVLVVSSSLSGCWPQRGLDAGRSYWNPFERELTSGRVEEATTVWDTVVGPQDPEPGGISGLVAVGDGVYATAAGGVVARLDDDSSELEWRRVLDAGQTSPPPGLYLPTVFGDWLFVSWSCCRSGIGGHFWVDRRDGTTDGGPGVPLGPGAFVDVAVAGGTLVTTSNSEGFAYELVWGSRQVVVTPYLGSDPSQPGNRFAIVGDRVMWTLSEDAVSFGPECRPSSEPQLSCAPDWRTDLGETYATPAAVGARSVAYTKPNGTGGSGTLTVLDAATGAVRWRADLGYSVGLSEPVVSRRTIVARTTDGRLVAFPAGGCGAAVCEPVWQTAPATVGSGEMAAARDVLYAITPSGDVAAYDLGGCEADICEPLVTLDAGAAARTPIVHAGRLIVGTADGHVVAFGLHHRH